ncbi:MAG: sugar ABC transporter ATP-binding protein [Stappiaceae bacterium]
MAKKTGAMPNILEMTGIEKHFGPVTALNKVDFHLERGEIHALLGVNGAGKSTLIKILSGIYAADNGRVVIDGEECLLGSPAAAIDQGVAAVQQHPELVGDLTGYENIFLGQEGADKGLFKRIDRIAMRTKAEKLLERFPVEIDLAKKIDDLAAVEKEIIAVLHALKQENVKILILDEPTSTLTRVEKVQLFKMMNLLKNSGVSIIYITHRLEEVFEVADRFTVFRGGRTIATLTAEMAQNEAVSIPQLMLQQEMGELFPPKSRLSEETTPALEAQSLSLAGSFSDIDFQARSGEILGFFGLVGSGIDELAKTLFGALQPDGGNIILRGHTVRLPSPKAALKHGIFLVPGDRRTEGLVLSDDVTFNTTLANLRRASFLGARKFNTNRQTVGDLIEKVELTPPTLNRAASAFSGGNQQKIVIAKGLYSQSDTYIFVEPTVGVDVGARSTLYGLIRELSREAAVIVMSSDCDEVFGLSDRMSALYRGHLVVEPNAEMTRDELLSYGLMGSCN